MEELEKDLEELINDENKKKKNTNINIIDEKEDILLDDNSVEIIKKYVKKKCEHNKRKSQCKECKGSQICEHNKVKSQCKECGGSAYCEHNKQKRDCKECGGSGICEHNKRKSQCKECGGSGICEHNKQKSHCKECGGSSICEHNKRKSTCKECGGSSICEHNKIKSTCKECGGSEICEHNKRKSTCKECGGSEICEHNKQKSYCKDCGGSAYCEHNKQKRRCKQCGGSGICEHNKLKSTCKECGGSELCKSSWCETYGNKKYNGYCLICCVNLFPEIQVTRNYKTKEKDVVDRIIKHYPNFTWVSDKKVEDGCSKRRPDLLLDLGTHILIIEVDENKHNEYNCLCENKRLMEISKDLNHRSIIFIRFNPDGYVDLNGNKISSCWKTTTKGLTIIKKEKEWEERINKLKSEIQYWIDNKIEKTIEIIELFY